MSGPDGDRTEFKYHDYADFAQEFLRRNPDYRLQYRQLGEAAVMALGTSGYREMAHHWGLEFPVST